MPDPDAPTISRLLPLTNVIFRSCTSIRLLSGVAKQRSLIERIVVCGCDRDSISGTEERVAVTNGSNCFTWMTSADERSAFGDDGSSVGKLSKDPIDLPTDLPGSKSMIALMNEKRRSIPAENFDTSVKELTTIDKSSKMCPNAEAACEITPISTLPAKYSGATTM